MRKTSALHEPAGHQRGLRVQTRVSLSLLVMAALFAIVLAGLYAGQRHQLGLMVSERAAETERQLAQIVALRASGAQIHADDYTRWDDFVTFVRTRDPEWARINLTESIPTFGLDVAWILDERFRQHFVANPEDLPGLEKPPVPAGELARILSRAPIGHFFAHTPQGLLEVWTSSIVPSADFQRATPARGYYLVGRLWTPQQLADLQSVMGGAVEIVPPLGFRPGRHGAVGGGTIEVRTAFPGFDGRPVAGLVYRTAFPLAKELERALRASILLASLASLLLLVVVWLALGHWVGRPLDTITRAMESEDTTPLADIARRHDDLGEVARLVQSFFVQREGLIAARQAAEAATLAKSSFLANMSHELRTPMHGILSFSRFGLRGAASATREELEDHFRQINDCGESLLTLLNALLDLSKLEAGRMVFSYSDVSLPDVADVAIDEFRSLYHERRIELRADFEPGLPAVIADRTRMLQVVRNLVSNAAKFTPAGGVVRVRVESAGKLQRILVEDSGMGIPPGEEDLIFHKFTQASHTSPRTGGTGLGLAISREIVEAHEGRIWAENREGGGARLVLEVPVEGPAQAREPADEKGAIPKAGADTSSATPVPATNANALWRKAA